MAKLPMDAKDKGPGVYPLIEKKADEGLLKVLDGEWMRVLVFGQ